MLHVCQQSRMRGGEHTWTIMRAKVGIFSIFHMSSVSVRRLAGFEARC